MTANPPGPTPPASWGALRRLPATIEVNLHHSLELYLKWISSDTVSTIKNWWRFAKIRSGPAFLTVTRGTSVKINRVAKRNFERGIKRLSLKAGVDSLSGHSPRVGMSQDLCRLGGGNQQKYLLVIRNT